MADPRTAPTARTERDASADGVQIQRAYGGDDVLSMGYTELIGPLIRAVQELSARVKQLESLK